MKKSWRFISKTRIIIAGVLSILLVFYFLNFIPRSVNILASRTFVRQILDYLLNFVIFFVATYLPLAAISFLYTKIFKK